MVREPCFSMDTKRGLFKVFTRKNSVCTRKRYHVNAINAI
jgi:hypothetical protein